MDKKRLLKYSGIFLVFIGISFLLNSFEGIMGFAIYEGFSKNVGRIIGLVIIIFGGLFYFAAKSLEQKIDSAELSMRKYYMTRALARSPNSPYDIVAEIERRRNSRGKASNVNPINVARKYFDVYYNNNEFMKDIKKQVSEKIFLIKKKVFVKMPKQKEKRKEFLVYYLIKEADDEIREGYFDKINAERQLEGKNKLSFGDAVKTGIFDDLQYKQFKRRAIRQIIYNNKKVKRGEWVLLAMNPNSRLSYDPIYKGKKSYCVIFGDPKLSGKPYKNLENMSKQEHGANSYVAHIISDTSPVIEKEGKYCLNPKLRSYHIHWEMKHLSRKGEMGKHLKRD